MYSWLYFTLCSHFFFFFFFPRPNLFISWPTAGSGHSLKNPGPGLLSWSIKDTFNTVTDNRRQMTRRYSLNDRCSAARHGPFRGTRGTPFRSPASSLRTTVSHTSRRRSHRGFFPPTEFSEVPYPFTSKSDSAKPVAPSGGYRIVTLLRTPPPRACHFCSTKQPSTPVKGKKMKRRENISFSRLLKVLNERMKQRSPTTEHRWSPIDGFHVSCVGLCRPEGKRNNSVDF